MPTEPKDEEDIDESDNVVVTLRFKYLDKRTGDVVEENLKTDGNGMSMRERMEDGDDAEEVAQEVLAKFNAHLRPGEGAREFVSCDGFIESVD